MPTYVIERPMPGAHELDADDLRAISEKTNTVLADMGGDVQWLHSYVAEDKLFCLYLAPNVDRVLEHARCSGLPVEAVRVVSSIIDPGTGRP